MSHPLDIDLGDYAWDWISEPHRKLIDAHLAECSLCRVKVARMRQHYERERSARDGPDGEQE